MSKKLERPAEKDSTTVAAPISVGPMSPAVVRVDEVVRVDDGNTGDGLVLDEDKGGGRVAATATGGCTGCPPWASARRSLASLATRRVEHVAGELVGPHTSRLYTTQEAATSPMPCRYAKQQQDASGQRHGRNTERRKRQLPHSISRRRALRELWSLDSSVCSCLDASGDRADRADALLATAMEIFAWVKRVASAGAACGRCR
ncbi:unnamed protein product [Triticum turgidum subsp. durum]|uniref:Uncharacterized protein n=1 Tax=Triticum turgidum subsp. durum TaxID=4567 RepID=A0A9R0UW86_TRITD|nr:unnamed protein product [Triticum turgidum subsp. durum]